MVHKVLKKILPKSYTLNTMDRPMHAGEIYYLWEALTAGYQVINITEAYMMNTADKKLHLLMQGFSQGVRKLRTEKLESVLKDAGFTVPPRPASKTLQGKPGIGQEVKLSDEEVIRQIYSVASSLLFLDGRGIGAVTTSNEIRDLFVGLLRDDMKAYELLFSLGKSRHVFDVPPPVTSAVNSLNAGELYWLWFAMDFRHSSILQLDTFINNTKDTGLLKEIEYGLHQVTLRQIDQLEEILKQEGFTVPPRPVDRTKQQPQGIVGRIRLTDNEVTDLLISAAQLALNNHIRAYTAAYREDVVKQFKEMIFTEIDNIKRLTNLAINYNLLENPPYVTARRG